MNYRRLPLYKSQLPNCKRPETNETIKGTGKHNNAIKQLIHTHHSGRNLINS